MWQQISLLSAPICTINPKDSGILRELPDDKGIFQQNRVFKGWPSGRRSIVIAGDNTDGFLSPFAVQRSCHITPISTTVLTAEEIAYFAFVDVKTVSYSCVKTPNKSPLNWKWLLARHRFRFTRVSFEDLEVNKKQPACQDSLLDMARGNPHCCQDYGT